MNSRTIKKGCNIVIGVLTIVSIFMLLKFSDAPNIFNIKFMERPHDVPEIWLSIFTSFVVTAVFYFIMNFIPDIIKEKEDEEKSLPYRCDMQRDIQLFVCDLLHVWSLIIKDAAKKNDTLDVSKIDSISSMFGTELIIESASAVKVFGESNTSDGQGGHPVWASVISMDMKKIESRGEKILGKYTKDIPVDVYYAIKYLLDFSPIFGTMIHTFDVFVKLCDKNASVANCIAADESGKVDLEKTAKSINSIYVWVNEEYHSITKHFSNKDVIEIFEVNLENYLPQKELREN